MLSVTLRIHLQLTKNPKHAKKYLRGLMRSFDVFNHEVYSKLGSHHNISSILDLTSGTLDEITKTILGNGSFIQDLELFIEELQEEMFSLCVDRLTNKISCKHELEEHIEEIKGMSQVIVTELFFFKIIV